MELVRLKKPLPWCVAKENRTYCRTAPMKGSEYCREHYRTHAQDEQRQRRIERDLARVLRTMSNGHRGAEEMGKNIHAVALAKLGARKGGLARAASLTHEERQEIGRKGAEARWGGVTRVALKRRRIRAYRCGTCGQEGHTSRSHPHLT